MFYGGETLELMLLAQNCPFKFKNSIFSSLFYLKKTAWLTFCLLSQVYMKTKCCCSFQLINPLILWSGQGWLAGCSCLPLCTDSGSEDGCHSSPPVHHTAANSSSLVAKPFNHATKTGENNSFQAFWELFCLPWVWRSNTAAIHNENNVLCRQHLMTMLHTESCVTACKSELRQEARRTETMRWWIAEKI